MPYIGLVATGKKDKLTVFGDDYNTVDGTGGPLEILNSLFHEFYFTSVFKI